MAKKSVFPAILKAKCPRCHKGQLFESKPYNLRKFTRMHEQCSHCDVQFAREPRFFEGAMYISYVISVALFLTNAFVIYTFWGRQPVWVFMTSIIVAVILLYPLTFRYSRILYLYAFGNLKYDESVVTDQKN